MNRKCNNPDCDRSFSISGRRINCSRKCTLHVYYLRNKKSIIKKVSEYQNRNPEKTRKYHKKSMEKFVKDGRMAKAMKKYRLKNKNKCYSRVKTRLILLGHHRYKKYELDNKCRRCGEYNNLEIHHEEYPIRAKEIRVAIDNNKIYYLCKKCHRRLTNNNNRKYI